MSYLESSKYTKEEILEKKTKELVQRNMHINFQKKGKLMERRLYWKKKYNKRGRNGHKKEDKIIRSDREEKYKERNENEYFIYIKEVKITNKTKSHEKQFEINN